MPNANAFLRVVATTAIAMCGAASSLAAPPVAMPVVRNGGCPTGYLASGDYCKPGAGAHAALPRSGACPSGWSASGNYCVAGARARAAVPRQGACPAGWSASGGYCLAGRWTERGESRPRCGAAACFSLAEGDRRLQHPAWRARRGCRRSAAPRSFGRDRPLARRFWR